MIEEEILKKVGLSRRAMLIMPVFKKKAKFEFVGISASDDKTHY